MNISLYALHALCELCIFIISLFELDVAQVVEGGKHVGKDTKVRNRGTRVQYEWDLRVGRHLSISAFQNMASKTSKSI